ncbi:MAG TPA: hydrogenase maturation protease [Terracidiphilus sp.]|nr:hydrogenase maturation protease [Terracidiphilus sp.]
MAPCALILACGNPLRSDDGLAWHAAELLRQRLPESAAEILCTHQLTPELAEPAARAQMVIVIDAAGTGAPGEVHCAAAPADPGPGSFSHRLAPAQLLALCSALYGAHPQGFVASIAGADFDHGDTLSPTVRAALPQLVDAVVAIVLGECPTAPPQ